MPSKLLDELVGKEVSISIFNGMPIKGTVVEVDETFIKVETPSRNFNTKEYYVNKAMIASVTVK